MASFLAGYLSPGLTATSQAVGGYQRGNIEGFLEKRRLEREAKEDALHQHIADLREREISDRENALQYVTDEKGNLVGLPRFLPSPGEHAARIAAALPLNPSAGAGSPTQETPSPTDHPSTGGSSIARSAFGAFQTGVKMPVKHGPTRIAEAPGGKHMVEQQQPNGAWSPALTAQGDTVFSPVASPRASSPFAKTPAERDRDTHLHVLNEQLSQTQKELSGWKKAAQAGMNPAADGQALALVPIANAKIKELSARSDSLTAVRDRLAGGLGQGGGTVATPVRPTHRPPSHSANYVAPPGLPPLSAAEQQKAMTDPDYRAYKEALGYKFTAPAGNAPQ